MEYLVTMTTRVPDGTPEETVQETRAREAARAAELAEQGRLLRLWRPPLRTGEWRTYGLFTAGDAEELEATLASMPLRVWRSDEVTPLAVHPNDPAGSEGSTTAVPGTEYFTWFTFEIPSDASAETVEATQAAEAHRTRELAHDGRLLRLWMLPGVGRALGLWSSGDATELQASLDSLPLIAWLGIEVTQLSVHPSDPAQLRDAT